MMWHLGFCVFLPIALSSNIILFIYISIYLFIHAFFQVNIGLVFNFFFPSLTHLKDTHIIFADQRTSCITINWMF